MSWGSQIRTGSRAVRVLGLYIAALCLLAVLMSADIWWLDAAYVGMVFAVLFVLSARAVWTKWHSTDAKHVTKHGPTAAYPDGWRRWLMDDYPDDRAKHR